MGTCIDIADKLVISKKRKDTRSEVSFSRAKYYIFAGLFATAVFGAQLFWLMDPISLLVRGLTLGLFATMQMLFFSLKDVPATGWLVSFIPNGFPFPETQSHFRAGFAALLIMSLILSGGLLSRRFWCRSMCPLGALLGLISRIPIFRRSVTDACSECTLCKIDCKMDGITDSGRTADNAECIFCYSCVSRCPKDAVGVTIASPGDSVPLSLTRRGLLASFTAGIVWSVTGLTATGKRKIRDGSGYITGNHLIRPPGSIREELFTEKCIRCANCMKVCPTNGLQPSVTEAGLAGLWTPVLVPRVGECTQMCNLCGQVCPTEAILPFDIPEKNHIFIGRAAINRSTCVVWESDKKCLVCDEVCSYDAIYWKEQEGIRRPHVDPGRCVGCGICENHCPAGGANAAIRVWSDGDKRHLSRERQKAWSEANKVDKRDSR